MTALMLAERAALAEIIEDAGFLRIAGEIYLLSRISEETLDTLAASSTEVDKERSRSSQPFSAPH